LVGLTVLLLAICLSAPHWLAGQASWRASGPLLLFLGLLTLVNAPFDWFSLGVTRALLRRGLERDGLWPLLYALIDVLISMAVIFVLAVTTVLAVQAFDAVALASGAKARVLDVSALLNSIETQPSAPENYWVYLLLVSTLLPSMINLMIGAASFLRGLPPVTRWLLARMPEGRAVLDYDGPWVALGLTALIYGGGAVGIILQAGIVWLMVGYVMPSVGLNILELAKDLTAADLPAEALRALLGLGHG
jgi:hypothetical protein